MSSVKRHKLNSANKGFCLLRNYEHAGTENSYARLVVLATRQRPGTAKGVIFLTPEDETRNSNIIVMPDVYDRNHLLVTRSKFLLVEGVLQNRDNVIHVKATRLMELSDRALEVQSHDFH